MAVVLWIPVIVGTWKSHSRKSGLLVSLAVLGLRREQCLSKLVAEFAPFVTQYLRRPS